MMIDAIAMSHARFQMISHCTSPSGSEKRNVRRANTATTFLSAALGLAKKTTTVACLVAKVAVPLVAGMTSMDRGSRSMRAL